MWGPGGYAPLPPFYASLDINSLHPNNIHTRYTQIGVVSYGNGCADAAYPGVYARVTRVVSWIKQIAVEALHSNCQLSASPAAGIATYTTN